MIEMLRELLTEYLSGDLADQIAEEYENRLEKSPHYHTVDPNPKLYSVTTGCTRWKFNTFEEADRMFTEVLQSGGSAVVSLEKKSEGGWEVIRKYVKVLPERRKA